MESIFCWFWLKKMKKIYVYVAYLNFPTLKVSENDLKEVTKRLKVKKKIILLQMSFVWQCGIGPLRARSCS